MKPWHLGALFVVIVVLATGSVAGVVLWVTDRADDRQAAAQAVSNERQEQQTAALLSEALRACQDANAERRALQTIGGILKRFAEAAAKARLVDAQSKSATPRERAAAAAAAGAYQEIADSIAPLPEIECDARVRGGGVGQNPG